MSIDYDKLRQEYRLVSLNKDEMDDDPVAEFDSWFKQAVEIELPLPNAMVLATISPDNKPSARYVLLKSFDQNGFVFFTHSVSDKGQHLEQNPHASLVFYWSPLHRQVRIEGLVSQVSSEEADEYFASRPYGSRIAVHVAHQSSSVESREFMEKKMAALELEFPDQVPRPDTWLGYRVAPQRIEFWQGRENRLHDRIVYEKSADGTWQTDRLAP